MAGPALAQTSHEHHGGLYEGLGRPGRMGLPETVSQQRVYDSLALKAGNPGHWIERAPLPTARSGHGVVLYRGRIFVMGGEGPTACSGKNEVYDPATDRWEQHAPMPTPRHGLGAAAIGDFIHLAVGVPVMGGGVQSAMHEAFTLG